MRISENRLAMRPETAPEKYFGVFVKLRGIPGYKLSPGRQHAFFQVARYLP